MGTVRQLRCNWNTDRGDLVVERRSLETGAGLTSCPL